MNDVPLPSSPDSSTAHFSEERERIHRNMLSAVAHDLKTPLASIIGSLEVYSVMREKLTAEKKGELIQVALQEAYRLDSFIANILDMARLENGVIKPKAERTDIGALLSYCQHHMNNRMPRGAFDIEEKSGIVHVMTDSALLSRAVCLVLDNAIKYGGAPPEVRIEFGKNTGAYIRVRDNGGGIPAGKLGYVFDKYSRLDQAKQEKTAGAGLGLTIARSIMSLLKGTIDAENHPDGGAVFTLTVPQG